MEALGLAVGIVGLAGLFSSVLELANKVQTYKTYDEENKILNAQFNAVRVRLRNWGCAVGVDPARYPAPTAKASYSAIRQELDAATAISIKELLDIANEALQADRASRPPSTRNTFWSSKARPSHSKREKLGWSLLGKLERKEQLTVFATVVEQLHQLLPPPADEVVEAEKDLLNQGRIIAQKIEENTQQWEYVESLMREIVSERRVSKPEMRTRVLEWLLGDNASSENIDKYHHSLSRRLRGTGDWIFDHPVFAEWLRENHDKDSDSNHSSRLLWITAHAGFGKTILCAHIVEYLLKNYDDQVAYFFLSSQAGGWQDAFIILRQFIAQLIQGDKETDGAFDLAFSMWASSQEASIMATSEEVVHLLKEILAIKSNCTLIIDGLDECTILLEGANSATAVIRQLKASLAKHTRLLITSRHNITLQRAICPETEPVAELRITPEDVEGDALAIAKDIICKKNLKSKADEEILTEELAAKSDGQILWLKMQEESLKHAYNLQQIEKIIEETPTKIFDVYEHIWNEIQQRPDRQDIFNLLRWVAFSCTPLTIGELSEAMLIDDSSQSVGFHRGPDEIDQTYLDVTYYSLHQLLRIWSEPGMPSSRWKVGLSHFTVKEFLLEKLPTGCLNIDDDRQKDKEWCYQDNEPAHNSTLARMCLVYIHSAWTCPYEKQLSNYSGSRISDKYFAEYAADYWFIHLNQADVDKDTLDKVLSFMTPNNPTWSYWTQRYNHKYRNRLDRRGRPFPKYMDRTFHVFAGPLHYSILLGLASTLEQQVIKKGFAFQCSLENFSALHLAAGLGDTQSVRVLLQHGTYPDLPSRKGTPLLVAAVNGHQEVLELLLNYGAEINAVDYRYKPAICYAAGEDNLKMVQCLVRRGAETTPESLFKYLSNKGYRLSSGLMFKGNDGHDLISQQLLEAANGQISALSVDLKKLPSLGEAVAKGHLSTVKLLLAIGAELDRSDEKQFPIHVAAKGGDPKIMQVLMEHPEAMLNLSALNPYGATALQVAMRSRSFETAQILLMNGARPDVPEAGKSRQELIQIASRNGRGHQVLELLLGTDHDYDHVNAPDDNGETPLFSAAVVGNVEIARILLQHGAQHTSKASTGLMPVHAAAAGGHSAVVELFLSHDLDSGPINSIQRLAINHRDIKYRTALFWASWYGEESVVEVILRDGRADLTIRDHFGLTPLDAAVRNGFARIVELLLSAGSQVNLKDFSGTSLIGWAKLSRHGDDTIPVLRRHAQKVGLHLPDDPSPSGYELAKTVPYISKADYRDDEWCDACTLWYSCVDVGETRHSECPKCGTSLGRIVICDSCEDRGYRCMSSI